MTQRHKRTQSWYTMSNFASERAFLRITINGGHLNDFVNSSTAVSTSVIVKKNYIIFLLIQLRSIFYTNILIRCWWIYVQTNIMKCYFCTRKVLPALSLMYVCIVFLRKEYIQSDKWAQERVAELYWPTKKCRDSCSPPINDFNRLRIWYLPRLTVYFHYQNTYHFAGIS